MCLIANASKLRHRPRGISAAVLVALSIGSLAGCASNDTDGDRVAALPSLAEIKAIVKNPERSKADRANDVRRQPVDMLDFIGVRPGMVALDISAGGGYTTELLARAVGPTGRVYGQSVAPANAPATPPRRTSAMALAERAKSVPNIVPVVRPFEDPAPPELASQKLDLVTLMYNYQDLG